eukprot:gene5966-9965_t
MGNQQSSEYSGHESLPKPKVEKSEKEWKEQLDDTEFYVCRRQGTESPFFEGSLHDFKGVGKYNCKGCNQLLFNSTEKYDSGTGWPSFFETASKNSVTLIKDGSRTEVVCSKCHCHLGHVFFNQTKSPNGTRYCMNSVSLKFEE